MSMKADLTAWQLHVCMHNTNERSRFPTTCGEGVGGEMQVKPIEWSDSTSSTDYRTRAPYADRETVKLMLVTIIY